MENAPLYDDVAERPEGGRAYWLTAADGVRLRCALWPLAQGRAAKGTVFILPGRTEWLEKYAPAAQEFAQRGYAALSIDWRGQGIADKLLKDRRIGHVGKFTDYQADLRAVMSLAEAQDMPKPWFLLGHSMGGAIGLRAIMTASPFKAAAFSAPMWGIGMSTWQKLLAAVVAPLFKLIGFDKRLAPGTKPATYTDWHAFEDNLLTADPEMYRFMKRSTDAQPDLGMGGPSSHWVLEAIAENDWAAAQPAPDVPAICFLGGDEQIVNKDKVRRQMARWPRGELVEIPGARHEFPMETPEVRKLFYDRIVALFDAQAQNRRARRTG